MKNVDINELPSLDESILEVKLRPKKRNFYREANKTNTSNFIERSTIDIGSN